MSAPFRWGRAWRLTGAALQWGGWQSWAVLVLLVLFMGAGNLAAMRQGHWAPLGGFQMLTFVVMLLYSLTGPANTGWRYLPATARERRGAAWINVSALPLVLVALSALFSGGLALFLTRNHPGAYDVGLLAAIFGVQGGMIEVLALMLLLVANWPASMMRYWQPGQRQMRDWMLVGVFIAVMLGGMLKGGELIHQPGIGLPSPALAVGLCGLGLPLAQRFIRIDNVKSQEEGLVTTLMPDLRLKGLSGHFMGQGLRIAGISALLLAVGWVLTGFAPRLVPANMATADAMAGFRVGIGVWVQPAPLAMMMVMINLQAVLRQRRLLLSLPHGRLMVLAQPAFIIAIAYSMASALYWHDVTGTAAALRLSLAGFGMALALAYVYLALSLRATRMIEVMLGGMVASIPIGFLAFLAMDAARGGHVLAHWLGLSLGTSAALLALGLGASVRLLNTSRRPYRPWPIASNRWHGV